jgi:hypothetical protein
VSPSRRSNSLSAQAGQNKHVSVGFVLVVDVEAEQGSPALHLAFAQLAAFLAPNHRPKSTFQKLGLGTWAGYS